MTQLLLNLTHDWFPTLDNFVPGRNVELISALQHALAGTENERFFYLWGKQGSGKSHLLHAAVAHARSMGQAAAFANGVMPGMVSVVAIDDVEALDVAAQIDLFALYNRMRENGGMLLVSGVSAPAHLNLRDDLRTRLGWGLVYQVHALNETEIAQALEQHGQARGFSPPREVVQYLLRHGRRDMSVLLELMDALDEQCLRLQRVPSVPLLKEVMQTFNLESV